jgi:hypothetical protein
MLFLFQVENKDFYDRKERREGKVEGLQHNTAVNNAKKSPLMVEQAFYLKLFP